MRPLPFAGLAILLALTGQDRAPGKEDRPKARAEESKKVELERADRYFVICDHDGDGWISFNEARASLRIDRSGWAAYDTDRDGRIVPLEFRRRYEEVLENGGAFLPPRPKAESRAPIPARADDALETYDKDRDRALEHGELEILLVQVGAARLEAETALEQFDRDSSAKLESAEIEDFLTVLQPSSARSKGPRPRSIEELFGQLVPREIQEGSTPQPVRILPPVRSFRRLDMDADGLVSLVDLAELQRPLVLPVRSGAVLAALDTNGDGGLDEAEFRASMLSAP